MAREIKCLCGEWHIDTGLTMGGAPVIACPSAPDDYYFGFDLVGRPETREVRDGQDA